MQLRGKTALVTGGAVRVGRAIGEALVAEGMRLIVHYNSSSADADQLVAQVRAGGGEAVGIGADLARTDEVRRLADDAVRAFGGVDVLVNSASVFPPQGLEETDEALWDHTMAVNLRAPFFLTRHLAPSLRERRGAVVNMCDLAGIQPWRGYAAHGIAKAGMVHLTQVAARTLAPEVRVNGIAPGAVLPPASMDEAALETIARTTPLQRIGSAGDVVTAVLYLLRADYVTGEVLIVDGGRMLRG